MIICLICNLNSLEGNSTTDSIANYKATNTNLRGRLNKSRVTSLPFTCVNRNSKRYLQKDFTTVALSSLEAEVSLERKDILL